MADEATPGRPARRAADEDAPTMILPVVGSRGARRSVTPDWDDDDDDLDDIDDADDAEELASPLPVTAVPPPPAGDHDAFRPPADDADTVVIKRGDLAAALAAMGTSTPASASSPVTTLAASSATPTWRPVSPTRPTPNPSGTESPAAPSPTITATERLAAMRGSDATPPTAKADPAPAINLTRPTNPTWLLPVAGILALVLVIGGAVWWFGRATPGPQASSTPTQRASAVAVLTQADLAGVADAGLAVPVGWTVESTTSPVTESVPAPLCLSPVPNAPAAAASFQRKLVGTPAALVHRAEAYETIGDASSVMAVRTSQVGRCANVPVYLSSGAAIKGLGDQAVAVTAVVQDPTPVHHTVVLVRTGTVIDTIDVWQPSTAIDINNAIATAAAVVGRQCARTGGACVTSPEVTLGPPPSGGIAGWLTVSDLPRLTPGIGRWTASEPTSTIRVISSQCENVTFATTPATQKRQRTFLLTEDNVPKGFGLDEVMLDFDTPEAAGAFAKSVIDNVETCTTRVPTAKLGAGATFAGTGTSGEVISGYWRTVSQPTSASTSATFRITVAAVGKRVVYLLLTPSGTYDFSDEAWATLGLRAAQRATQQA
ncbi:MAG TPA: hypothetical protein PKM36_12825 [Propionibacteriaceae bacterium]|nr:hypothetical protein [Propionibacteriaceae bacterium]HQE32294.1 hypothetical protein [Propionibacteriaceae bacterium]